MAEAAIPPAAPLADAQAFAAEADQQTTHWRERRMPTYTYVMAHKGAVAVHQTRKSNFKGWIAEAVSSQFPALGNDALGALMRCEPKPVSGAEKTWSASAVVEGSLFVITVVETRVGG